MILQQPIPAPLWKSSAPIPKNPCHPDRSPSASDGTVEGPAVSPPKKSLSSRPSRSASDGAVEGPAVSPPKKSLSSRPSRSASDGAVEGPAFLLTLNSNQPLLPNRR